MRMLKNSLIAYFPLTAKKHLPLQCALGGEIIAFYLIFNFVLPFKSKKKNQVLKKIVSYSACYPRTFSKIKQEGFGCVCLMCVYPSQNKKLATQCQVTQFTPVISIKKSEIVRESSIFWS